MTANKPKPARNKRAMNPLTWNRAAKFADRRKEQARRACKHTKKGRYA